MHSFDPSPAQYDRLHRLFVSAFTPETLQSLLLRLEGGRTACHELPSVQGVPLHFFHRVTEVLRQHGLVGEPLFTLLIEHRPHRRAEIAAVAAELGVAVESPATSSTRAVLVTSFEVEADDATMPPVLGAWCWQQRRPLTMLTAGPGAVAAIAWVLGSRLDGADAPDRLLLAVEIGHAVFASAALVVFALWQTPTHSRLFGPSPTYALMWRRLGALEQATPAQAPELRAAAGADPRTREALTRWLDAAIEARGQIRRSWLWLWLSWMSLYGVAVAVELGRPRLSPHAYAVLKILLTSLNNSAAASLLVTFWILSFVTVPIEERRDATRTSADGVGGVAAALVIGYGLAELATVLHGLRELADASEAAQRARIEALAGGFDIGSGLISAVIMAMFVGRLDSKFISASWAVIVTLYLYAAIQPSWSFLELVERTGAANHGAERLVFVFAWLGKLVLFTVFAWMFHTGRLDFYFLRVRRLQAGVAADWRALTG